MVNFFNQEEQRVYDEIQDAFRKNKGEYQEFMREKHSALINSFYQERSNLIKNYTGSEYSKNYYELLVKFWHDHAEFHDEKRVEDNRLAKLASELRYKIYNEPNGLLMYKDAYVDVYKVNIVEDNSITSMMLDLEEGPPMDLIIKNLKGESITNKEVLCLHGFEMVWHLITSAREIDPELYREYDSYIAKYYSRFCEEYKFLGDLPQSIQPLFKHACDVSCSSSPEISVIGDSFILSSCECNVFCIENNVGDL